MTTLLSSVDRGLDPQDPATLIRELTQQARHRGPSTWLVLLADRKIWNALPSFVQDQVAAALCQVLGPGWSSEGAAEFSVPELSQRIHWIRYSPLGKARGDQGSIHWQFAIIPGGDFSMGYRHSPSSRMTHAEASPQRKVSIAPFLLGRSPVTQEMWDQVGGKDEREWREPALPIERVSWSDARDWLDKPQVGLRLPSEAEWEYACRGGTESRFFFGDNKSQLRHYAWFNLNSNKRTHAVAEKRPNPFGPL
jgi:formylglycine-generating enzyme required for sulfatase activity